MCWCSCFLVWLLGWVFSSHFSIRPYLIQQMGWTGCREWPAVHLFFFCILLCSSLSFPYIPYIIQITHWALNKYLLSKSYAAAMQPLTVSKGWQVILSIITLPSWKKLQTFFFFFDHYFMLWWARDEEAWQESQEETVYEARIAKKGTENIFHILWNVEEGFTHSLKYFAALS